MQITKRVQIATEAVLDIAWRGGTAPVRSRALAERLNIPRRYLEQTLQHLVRAGVLRSIRGPHGGYTLARERRNISVADIVRVVRERASDGEDGHFTVGSDLGRAALGPFWATVESDIFKWLEQTSVEDLCATACKNGIRGDKSVGVDFMI